MEDAGLVGSPKGEPLYSDQDNIDRLNTFLFQMT